MTTQNPGAIPENRAKSSARRKGKPFPVERGGNGTGLTEPQQILLSALGKDWVAEYKVFAGRASPFPEWPIMLVDLAFPTRKIAVDTQGYSHNNYKVRERDAKKRKILESLGWTFFTFTNAEAREETARIAAFLAAKIGL